MKTYTKTVFLTVLTLSLVSLTSASEAGVTGKWKGQFESQIGLQKYTFDLKSDGEKLTGKAIGEREMGTNEVVITEGKITGDQVSFVEPLKFDDNEIRIEYKGTVAGDEIKLHRKVGDFAEEDFVAKRVKETEGKPAAQSESKPGTNSAPAAPQNLH